jgi:hypothetical protein
MNVKIQHTKVVDHLTIVGLVDAADHLDQAAREILTSSEFPKANWKQIWSNNLKND